MKKFNSGIKTFLTQDHYFLGGSIGINTPVYVLEIIECMDFESSYAFVIGYEYDRCGQNFENIDIIDAYLVKDYDEHIETYKQKFQ